MAHFQNLSKPVLQFILQDTVSPIFNREFTVFSKSTGQLAVGNYIIKHPMLKQDSYIHLSLRQDISKHPILRQDNFKYSIMEH